MRNHASELIRATVVAGLFMFAQAALAWDADTAVTLALEQDEGLKALERRQAGVSERAVSESALPDPEIMIGAEGVPVPDPFDADMMTMYKLGVRQRIPAGDTLDLNRERALHQADGLGADIAARRLEIARQTRLAWLDWASAGKALSVARETARAFEELESLTEARYRAGTGRLRDIDQARLELSILQRRILVRQTRLDEAASRLARWTGAAPPGTPQGWFQPRQSEHSADRLRSDLLQHPILTASDHRIEAGITDTRLARQSYRPSWMIEAGYAHTRGTNPMTMQRQSDKLFAMVSFSLPLFTGNRQDRQLAAARAELQALGHDRGLQLQELRGQLERQLSLRESHARQLDWMESQVLANAEATVESTQAAYRTDRATFDELVRARIALLDQQLEIIDIRQALAEAEIRLAWLTAEELQ